MKRFVIFYEHRQYGRYSIILEHHNDIGECLTDFIENHVHKAVYGIMEIQ